jgi:PPM family protein phosphatase
MAEYFYGITDKGKRRQKNEDTFFAREIINKRFLVASVIDGVGGYKGGDIAAAIARSVIMKNLETLSENVIEALRQAIIAANFKINQEKKGGLNNERMACVLSCIVADKKNNKCWYAHVGDTRIYLLRDHSLVKISKDHSTVGFLEESGVLSEEEAMRHPRRNEINKALGFEEDISTPEDFIETGESPFLPGDVLLLCSDGLTDMVSSATITSVLTSKKNLASRAKALVDAANDAGGNDNITAVLVENTNWPKQTPEPVPVERKKCEITSPVSTTEVAAANTTAATKENVRNPIALSIFLLCALVAVFLTVAFQNNNKRTATTPIPVQMIPEKNEQLVELMSKVNDSSKSYAFAQKGAVIKTPGPLVINKDSFHLNGNGAILTSEHFYRGPALIIDSKAKRIVLDSLVLKNFDVGIVVQKNNVILRNIRFINCRTPVQYLLSFRDSVISGRFKDSIFVTH